MVHSKSRDVTLPWSLLRSSWLRNRVRNRWINGTLSATETMSRDRSSRFPHRMDCPNRTFAAGRAFLGEDRSKTPQDLERDESRKETEDRRKGGQKEWQEAPIVRLQLHLIAFKKLVAVDAVHHNNPFDNPAEDVEDKVYPIPGEPSVAYSPLSAGLPGTLRRSHRGVGNQGQTEKTNML